MANPLKSVKKSEKTLKLSRRQKWRRNPIPWAILLAVAIAIAAISVVPNTLDWIEKKSVVNSFETDNKRLEEEIDQLKKIRNQEQDKFNQLAKNTLSIEAQRFPVRVDVTKIAQVLEIYALQLNLSNRTFVQLSNLNFSASRLSDRGDFYETPVSLTVSIDRDSLKRFIEFLQTGLYDAQLTVDTIAPENKGETAALEFLDDNLLPITQIRSINMAEDAGETNDFPRTVYNVQMQLVMFSQSE